MTPRLSMLRRSRRSPWVWFSSALAMRNACRQSCRLLCFARRKTWRTRLLISSALVSASFSCSVRVRSKLRLRWPRLCHHASANSSRPPSRLALTPEVETFSRCRPSWRAAVSTLNLMATMPMRAPKASLKSGNTSRNPLPPSAWPSSPQRRSLDRTWRCARMTTSFSTVTPRFERLALWVSRCYTSQTPNSTLPMYLVV
mmetsp:Transcript_3864/g.17786  ORF Transcript_3864/g.17786 Transcript_3864/m.17786 type:complete len:200 (-) Transcript_3864:1555-2154(-)